jgi:Uma2 family endonuclease
MIASPQLRLTPEQYLDLEAQSPIKHEYINGDVLAMAGTTDTHNTIALNLATLIRAHLRGSGCRVYFADIKVRLEHCNCFYYPDLLITCDPRDQDTSTYKRFPKLIIEVLSDSTEAFDRGDKFNDYQTLETLAQYVLVNTRHRRIELFTRQPSSWILTTYTQGSLALSSLDLTMDLMDLYEDVTLETPRIQTGTD